MPEICILAALYILWLHRQLAKAEACTMQATRCYLAREAKYQQWLALTKRYVSAQDEQIEACYFHIQRQRRLIEALKERQEATLHWPKRGRIYKN